MSQHSEHVDENVYKCPRTALHTNVTRKEEDSLRGLVALVTGSSAGIGAAIVKELSARGASVVINYPDPSLEQEAKDLGNTLSNPWAHVCADMGTLDGPEHLVDVTIADFGKIDILVNNAGRVLHAPFPNITHEIWDTCMNVNARGTFLVTQATLPHLPQKDKSIAPRGRIINICSAATNSPHPTQAAYVASKGAVNMLTRAWAVELPALHNVTVNAVAPGVVLTKGLRENIRQTGEGAMGLIQHLDAATPLEGWFGLPEEVAFAVACLADERSSFTNGAVVELTGGMTLQ